MAQITVYTTTPCAYCTQAKALLTKRGVTYEEVNLSRDTVGRAELVGRTGMMTFPQIIIGDEVIGGYDELHAADMSGRLGQLLAATGS